MTEIGPKNSTEHSSIIVYEGEFEKSVEIHKVSLAEYVSPDAKAYIIEDDAGYKEAADIINEIRATAKHLETLEKSATSGALETVSTIRDWFRPVRKLADEARKAWDQKVKDYLNAKQLQQQEVHKALQEAVAKGDAKEVHAGLARMEEKPEGNITVSKVWKWKVINRDLVPTQFTIVDERLINAEMRRQLAEGGNQPYVGGIEFFQENTVRSRG